MPDYNDTNDFDRLAGQPEDPVAGTRELVAATSPDNPGGSMVFGDMTFSEIKRVPSSGPPPSPVPWVFAIMAAIIAGVLFFAFVLPSGSRLEEVKSELEAAKKEVQTLQERVQSLEGERTTAEQARAAATTEAERLATELEALKRGDEAADANGKRKAATKASKKKGKRKRK